MRNFVLLVALSVLTAGCVSTGKYSTGGGGNGGESTQTYKDEWKNSSIVEDNGDVTMNPGETVTEHPSEDPDDTGFEGAGPPSIDG